MNKENFVLVDHLHDWSNLRPLTFTKPISHLRIGILKMYEKWNLFLDTKVEIKPIKAYLLPFNTFKENENSTFINSSIIPDEKLVRKIKNLEAGESLYANGTFIASKAGGASFETEINYSEEFLKIIQK